MEEETLKEGGCPCPRLYWMEKQMGMGRREELAKKRRRLEERSRDETEKREELPAEAELSKPPGQPAGTEEARKKKVKRQQLGSSEGFEDGREEKGGWKELGEQQVEKEEKPRCRNATLAVTKGVGWGILATLMTKRGANEEAGSKPPGRADGEQQLERWTHTPASDGDVC